MLYHDCEALEWLQSNQNRQAFASDRFSDTGSALEFVNRLYHLGAIEVRVSGILDEGWRLAEDGGPYADRLVVNLPDDTQKRETICALYYEEIDCYNCNDGERPLFLCGSRISFWWD